MTVPCLAEPAPAGDLDAAVDELRAHGLRLSASRRLVLEALFAAGRPVTAEEIASGMYGRLPRCDLASVYRNLETLEELGLVRHMHLGHGPGLYGPAAETDEYVACERCGRSEAVGQLLDGHWTAGGEQRLEHEAPGGRHAQAAGTKHRDRAVEGFDAGGAAVARERHRPAPVTPRRGVRVGCIDLLRGPASQGGAVVGCMCAAGAPADHSHLRFRCRDLRLSARRGSPGTARTA